MKRRSCCSILQPAISKRQRTEHCSLPIPLLDCPWCIDYITFMWISVIREQSDMDKTLELFRRNDLGITICYISYEEHSLVIPFEYNAFFDKNTQNFLSCLNGFENLKTAPWASEAGILQVFTSYFASFEQFISTLYEMLYFYKLKTRFLAKGNQRSCSGKATIQISSRFSICQNHHVWNLTKPA